MGRFIESDSVMTAAQRKTAEACQSRSTWIVIRQRKREGGRGFSCITTMTFFPGGIQQGIKSRHVIRRRQQGVQHAITEGLARWRQYKSAEVTCPEIVERPQEIHERA